MVTGEHTLQKYDVELEQMRSRILQMGGLAESQFKLAMEAFEAADVEKADLAIANDRRLNELQLDLDMMVNHLIARRQPTAGDLRMVMGVAKTITDLERIGDEAAKIGRASKWLKEKGSGFRMNRIPDLHQSGEIAARMLHRSLDAFARLDGHAAASIIRDDAGIDDRFRATLRQLITYMMEDPRSISSAIDTVWAAKAIERVGDHAKNIAEHVIFIAHGTDVRHASPEEIARAVSQG
jgi:phosphate transport system protein